MGPLIERGLLKWMYGKDEIVLLLVTYALFLILEDAIKLVWGVESKMFSEPYALLGNFQLGGLAYPAYNLVLIAVAVYGGSLCRGCSIARARASCLLAVIHDREVSAAMGINVSRFYLATFTGGAVLAALGGALTAPIIAVSPGIGVEVIVLSFAVVVIGGLGSLGGAALGALMVGLLPLGRGALRPEGELFVIYLVMAGVLILGRGPVQPAGGTAHIEDRTVIALVALCAGLVRQRGSRPNGWCFCSRWRSRRFVVLGLLLMRTGLVSFGQGLYFGLAPMRRRCLPTAPGSATRP